MPKLARGAGRASLGRRAQNPFQHRVGEPALKADGVEILDDVQIEGRGDQQALAQFVGEHDRRGDRYAGDVNARLLALLLNEPTVRAGLVTEGIEIPSYTRFVAGLHDTVKRRDEELNAKMAAFEDYDDQGPDYHDDDDNYGFEREDEDDDCPEPADA